MLEIMVIIMMLGLMKMIYWVDFIDSLRDLE